MFLPDLRELEVKTRDKQAAIQSDRKSGTSVTEGTLKDLLDKLCRNIAADISAFKEEISGVMARLHETEVTTACHETRLTTLDWELSTLWRKQAQTQYVAAMEDRRRWKNIKVQGLPDNIATAELPHLFRRLLAQLLFAKQAKLMSLYGCYRPPAPPASSTGVHRDIVICFQNSPDKQVFMTAIRNKSPYSFEELQLAFFPDLSRATLDWRRALRPLTLELTKHKVP
ncbi:Hypothetical predicted protein [Pelobates cultripes]|uniref:Uncharacterized protein n=1 Tax=Pelobates cultripes TaxID=61616 RepID=A0AAD1RC70_PELCU|nr:Hypothetical predicted protein [Pelobates cultripes]